MKELELLVKAQDILADLEGQLRELKDSHDDIYSNEHIKTREALNVIIQAKQELNKLSADLIPEDEFNLGKLF